MNNLRFSDVTIESTDYSRIDYIRMYAYEGYRLIHTARFYDHFIMIFRAFEFTKDYEIPITKSKKQKMDESDKKDEINVIFEESINGKRMPLPEAYALQPTNRGHSNFDDSDKGASNLMDTSTSEEL